MATLRLNVDPTGAVRGSDAAEDGLQRVERQAFRTEDALDDVSAASTRVGRGMGGATGGARGLAMQLSQVADMGVATGQWGRAFFMQMSDIAMLMGGPWMIAAGATVGVLGTIGLSFLEASDDAEELIEDVYEVSDSLRALGGVSRVTADDLDNYLTRAFGDSADEVERLILHFKELELTAAIRPVIEGLKPVRAGLREIEGAFRTVIEAQQMIEEGGGTAGLDYWQDVYDRNRDIVEQNIVLLSGLDDVKDAVEAIGQSESPEELAEKLAIAVDALEPMSGEIGTAARETLIALADEAGVLGLVLSNAAGEAERLADALPRTTGVAGGRGTVVPTGIDIVMMGMGGEFIPGRDRKPRARRTEQLKEQYDQLLGSMDATSRAAYQYEKAQKLLNEAQAAGVIDATQYDEAMALVENRFDDMMDSAHELRDAFNSVETGFESNIMAMVSGTQTFEESMRGMAREVIAQLYDILVVQQLVGSFSPTTGAGTGIMGFLGPIFGGVAGLRADGGDVRPGETYIVGERGPEPFTPSVRGTISPTGSSDSRVVVHQEINIAGIDREIESKIMQHMPRIAEASKAAVMDAVRRGGDFASAFR